MWLVLGPLILVAVTAFGQTDLPQVTISQGEVIGSKTSDGDYYEFYGIPYADSPSGSHRFKAPSPPQSFNEPFVANQKNIKCVRSLSMGYEGTEDCLVANIFTPSLDNNRLLPVMVWIKGKEFDKVYEQERTFKNFMKHDVVVVSLNFRESIFGFLCLGTETAPGNAGLKDIIAGLHWVQENIAAFGGNPDDITLFGHGSGAAAVDLVTFSPMAEGLIHKVISQSGNALAPWAVSRDNLEYAVKVAEALGHTIESTTTIETLSEVFARTDVAALMAVINELDLTDNSLAFAPCLENPNLENSDPFLVKSPYKSIKDGDFLKIPFMIGFVDYEGTIRAEEAIGSDWLEKMESSFRDFIQPDLKFETENEEIEISESIKKFYFTDDASINIDQYLTYHGDTMIVVSSVREALLRSSMSTESVYMYQFSYKGELGELFVGPSIVNSAAHKEELAYLFYEESDQNIPPVDYAVGDILVERWTNFAKTGDPSSKSSQIHWLPFTIDEPNYLKFHNDDVDDGTTLESDLQDPLADTIDFWNPIYDEHFLDARSRWTLTEDDDDDDDDDVDETELPQVSISQGEVIGSKVVDGNYYEFHGIPYAESTSGSHRFKAPSPPPSFNEPFIANRKNIRCVRALGVGYEGTEDCLVANIFTPSLDNNRLLPVMVWIKGKEFDRVYEQERTFKNFMKHDVVVVSLNFRESIFGFLCLGTETAPGNAGLKDIIAGLHWVQENIAAFGGNPDDITLFGHGSGAAAVDLVTFSPMAEGLIHKVISQSGNALAPWAVSRDNLEYAVKVAEALGHTIESTTTIETLSEVFARTNVAALMAIINELDLTDNSLAFAPCLENPNLENSDPFLVKSPYKSIKDGDFLKIPFMIGFVDYEGTIRAEEAIGSDWLEKMESSFRDFIQPDLKFETENEEIEISESIKKFYFTDDANINIDQYLTYHGDTMIVVSSVREALLRSSMSTESVYMYQFSYKGELGELFVGPSIVNSAAHKEELAYLFYEESDQDIPPVDYAVGDILVERWTNFAKTGDPSSKSSQIHWLPFTIDEPNYLKFHNDDVDDGTTLESDLQDPHADTIDFWNPIYDEHFLDARSRWTLTEDDDDDDDDVDETELPQVSISQGEVIGSKVVDGNYYEFHGIPYAESTSGSHRFKAPSPPPSFNEPFIANRKNIRCVRALGVGYEGTEDCLVANIFTPSLDNNRLLPVMVWIKGKEFDRVYEQERTFKNFMKHDVVVVSLNFRESIFGFLCLGTETAPGNAGLKDIIAGLHWVQENIAAFGGNPDDITLFGHGSGAAAVDLVTFSPMAEGLIHKVISQSGNALAPWAVSRDNLEYAVKVAEALGHTIESTTTIETLSEVFARTNVAALMAIINELDLTDNSLAFAPCLENSNLENSDPFLVKSPYKSIKDGDFLKIPFMIGFVDYEGTIRAEEAIGSDWLEKMESSFRDFIQSDLKFETEYEEIEISESIKKFYFTDDANINIDQYLTYHGDTMIVVSSVREALLRSSMSESVYMYQFSYKGELGDLFVGPSIVNSAAHKEELAYLFYEESDQDIPLKDYAVGDILVERWTNFAKTGNPTSEISQVIWSPFTVDDPHYLRFLDDDEINFDHGATLEIVLKDPHPDTINFWNPIYEEHFLDAQGRWNLTVRDEEDVNGSGDEDDGDEDDGDEDDGDEDNEGSGDDDDDDEECDEDDDDCGGSASTAVGYTFIIISLFSILSYSHSQMLL